MNRVGLKVVPKFAKYFYTWNIPANTPRITLDDGSLLIYRHKTDTNPFIPESPRPTSKALESTTFNTTPAVQTPLTELLNNPNYARKTFQQIAEAEKKTESTPLPPQLRERRLRTYLSESEIKLARQLRKSNPSEWTAARLAKRFNTTNFVIMQMVSAPLKRKSEWLNKPIRVATVKVEGAANSNPSLFQNLSNNLYDTKSLADLFYSSQLHAGKLIRLGIFNNVSLHLDSNANADNNILLDVTVKVEEKSRFYAKTGTEFGNNDGSVVASLNLRNVFGNAEVLETNYSYGLDYASTASKQPPKPFPAESSINNPFDTPPPSELPRPSSSSTTFTCKLTRPLSGSPDSLLLLESFLNTKPQLPSSFWERVTGLNATYKHLTPFGSNSFQYGLYWRHLNAISDTASNTVLMNQGHSIKSSLKYIFERDTTNLVPELEENVPKVVPKSGNIVKSTVEVAGFGGDTEFMKWEGEYKLFLGLDSFGKNQLWKDMFRGWKSSVSLRGGVMMPLAWNEEEGDGKGLLQKQKWTVADKFYLGGGANVRGLQHMGMGPRDRSELLL
ncbi:hypothetical protein HK098_006798 [Nowakowskiella sp. JEL0407]|nr:hypothetical protein HK098_006798 [Nowakowskiella sp. JEL0407]